MDGQGRRRTARRWRTLRIGLVLGLLVLALSSAAVGRADSHVELQAGDVAELIDAINTANSNSPTLHEIVLTAPEYELVAVNNNNTGPNGLPAISGQVLIKGDEATGAAIRRAVGAPTFRIFRVVSGGELHLENITVSNGRATGSNPENNGGGIHISGTGALTLIDSTVSDNVAFGAGGIRNSDDGTLSLVDSTVTGNRASIDGGGIYNSGTLSLTGSTISDNDANFIGGGIRNIGDATLTNSTVSDNTSGTQGGGIYTSTPLTLISSTVSDNTSGTQGGGILNFNATLEATDSTVSGNNASADGGGIGNSFGTVILNNSTVSGNNATRAGGVWNSGDVATLELTDSTVNGNDSTGSGGGIWNNFGTTNLTGSVVSGNDAGSNGGGILNSGVNASLTLNDSTVSDNDARLGGGIFNVSTFELNDSTVSDNTSRGDAPFYSGGLGGGIYNTGDGTLTNSSVRGNDSGGVSGGGIYNTGELTVTNSTVSGNSGGNGSGIANSGGGELTLINSTVSANTGSGFTGGINIFGGKVALINTTVSGNAGDSVGGIRNAGELTLTNSLVAANANNSSSNPDITTVTSSGVTIDRGYNLIGDGSGIPALTNDVNGNLVGSAEEPIDPRLDPAGLQDNGGPTETIALLDDSPALDHIPNGTNGCGDESAETPIVADQRGIERPQGDGCDIGAFELEVDDEDPVDPAERSDCKKGGWQEYGFRNQGQCVKFVNTGKDSR